MKSKILILSFISLSFVSCGDSKNDSPKSSAKLNEQNDVPLNPDIQTDYGQIGEYHTMDEYYINENGDKVWHGYRKNTYATLSPKTISYYEHGELKWTETYDEVGNVLTTNR